MCVCVCGESGGLIPETSVGRDWPQGWVSGCVAPPGNLAWEGGGVIVESSAMDRITPISLPRMQQVGG